MPAFCVPQKAGITLLYFYLIFDLNLLNDSFYLQKKKTVYDAY